MILLCVCVTEEDCSAQSTANNVGFTAQGTAKHRAEKQQAFAATLLRVARTCQVSEAVLGLQWIVASSSTLKPSVEQRVWCPEVSMFTGVVSVLPYFSLVSLVGLL